MRRILVVTEADKKVASGHLMECIELVEVLRDNGYQVSLLINDDMPETFQSRIPFFYEKYPKKDFWGGWMIREILVNHAIDLVIFNLRCIEDELLQYIREDYRGIILCIDELGHRHLSCDVIVNPMIDEYYHKYMDLDAKLYVGAKYLVLSRKIREFHERKKEIREEVKRICVSMGGVDPFGTTVKLAKWLPELLPEVRMDFVLGGGFPYWKDMEPLVRKCNKISVHKNIDYIFELFFEADLAFCAGGNTLHELACIGTPAIVIPSMPHEVRNGRAFEKKRSGVCLPITTSITMDDVCKGIRKVLCRKIREIFRDEGRKNYDGTGIIEILNALKEKK